MNTEFLYAKAEEFKAQNLSTERLINSIGRYISEHAQSLPERYEPKNIIESRFTPAEEAFEKGITSCGAVANISTAMLRHIGYKVKLIHGETSDSVDHAWVNVFDPESQKWTEYDLTQQGSIVPNTHIKKFEVDSWDEIKDKITEDHKTLGARQKQRG